jgi:hypothetical protein
MFSEQRLLRYLTKVRVLEAVRAAVGSMSGKSPCTRALGGGGVQALCPLFEGRAKPRPHHSPEYRDIYRPDLEYRDNPTPSSFPLTNQGGAGQTQEKQSPPGHGR